MTTAKDIARRVRLAHNAGAGFHLTEVEMTTLLDAAERTPAMDVTYYKFEQHNGWPPDGSPGLFFGFDADQNCSILRWQDGEWHGVRWQFDLERPLPQAFKRGAGTQDFVSTWSYAPIRYSDADANQQSTVQEKK